MIKNTGNLISVIRDPHHDGPRGIKTRFDTIVGDGSNPDLIKKTYKFILLLLMAVTRKGLLVGYMLIDTSEPYGPTLEFSYPAAAYRLVAKHPGHAYSF